MRPTKSVTTKKDAHDGHPFRSRAVKNLLLRTLRPLKERSVRVDDVAVEVRGRAAAGGGLRSAILAHGTDGVRLRGGCTCPGLRCTELPAIAPAVVRRKLLDVRGRKILVEVGGSEEHKS